MGRSTHFSRLPKASGAVVLRFPIPTRPVSINEVAGGHWAKRQRAVKPWREAAFHACREAGLGELPPSVVAVALPFRTNRRRDPHNYVGTVVKGIVDGIVAAGCLPDDTPEWVEVRDPELIVVGQEPKTLEAVVVLVPMMVVDTFVDEVERDCA